MLMLTRQSLRVVTHLAIVWAMLLVGARSVSAQLPANTNPNLSRFGYYFVNDKHGDARSTAWAYTNLYVAVPANAADSTASFNDWQTAFNAQLSDATFNHKAIYLILGECGLPFACPSGVTWDNILDVAASYWGQVVWVEIASENNMNRWDMQARVDLFNAKLLAHGLADRSAGAIYQREQILTTDGIYAAGLDFVSIEAYVDPSLQNNGPAAVSDLNSYLASAKSRVAGAGKQIVLVGQAYDRNGLWTNMSTLEMLQSPVYLNAYNDWSVVAIMMFSYKRSGGTGDHPNLRQPHCQIAAAMSIGPGCEWTILTGGMRINPNNSVFSPNGFYELKYQTDGNLVLYNFGSPVWAVNCWSSGCSSTGLWGNAYQPAGYATLQTDGNLVTYNSLNQPTFASWTNGWSSAYLGVGNNGTLRVFSPAGAVLWQVP
jgi:hypothetical protein